MSLDHKIANAAAKLTVLAQRYTSVAFATSLGAEDMVLLDLIML